MVRISKLLALPIDSAVEALGWVKSVRMHKTHAFIDVDDGSANIQVLTGLEQVKGLLTGASVKVQGQLKSGPKTPEIHADTLAVLGESDAMYPFAKKSHTPEHLRLNLHLRARTSTFAATMKLRSSASFAIHDFFRRKGAT
jgi:asparaginyl-tRNA synthetase